jgi:hypothetical protein
MEDACGLVIFEKGSNLDWIGGACTKDLRFGNGILWMLCLVMMKKDKLCILTTGHAFL